MSGAVIALFLVLLVIGFDVGFGMIATTYMSILTGDRMVNGTILPLQIVGGIDKYVLVAIPLFILTGEIMNRGGLTLIVTLHQVDYAMRYCDRVVALKAGKVVYDGPAQALSRKQLIDIYGPEFEDVFWEGAPQ